LRSNSFESVYKGGAKEGKEKGKTITAKDKKAPGKEKKKDWPRGGVQPLICVR